MSDAHVGTDPARVLGIDPGLARVGWGVVERAGPAGARQGFACVAYGSVQTRNTDSHAERLLTVFQAIQAVIDRYGPATAAVEEVFQSRSPRSAFLAGEGRGACVLAAATKGLRVVEYPPPGVKLAVTGNGRAHKQQVQAMVQRLLDLPGLPRPHDAADALAIAIAHLQRGGAGRLALRVPGGRRPAGPTPGERDCDRRGARRPGFDPSADPAAPNGDVALRGPTR